VRFRLSQEAEFIDKDAHLNSGLDQYELDRKEHALRSRLASLGSVLIAYSGGTDSAFLAWAAHKVLGGRMVAVLADSPSLPRRELKLAIEFAEHWQIPLKVIATEELERPDYVRNGADRCFHCKHELFTLLNRERQVWGSSTLHTGRTWTTRGTSVPGKKRRTGTRY
jgi:uncharacterized protein